MNTTTALPPALSLAPLTWSLRGVPVGGRRRPQCHAKLGDTSNALRCLVAIPPKSRSLKTQLLLGWLYKGSGLKRDAINAYKAALKLNPLALEAVMALAQLGGKGE